MMDGHVWSPPLARAGALFPPILFWSEVEVTAGCAIKRKRTELPFLGPRNRILRKSNPELRAGISHLPVVIISASSFY